MEPERILQIAAAKGEFRVSWRWRDGPLEKQCRRLVKRGLLRKVSCRAGETVFAPARKQEPGEKPNA